MAAAEPLQVLLGIVRTLQMEGANDKTIDTVLSGTNLPKGLVHIAEIASGAYTPSAVRGHYSGYHAPSRYPQ